MENNQTKCFVGGGSAGVFCLFVFVGLDIALCDWVLSLGMMLILFFYSGVCIAT